MQERELCLTQTMRVELMDGLASTSTELRAITERRPVASRCA
jgi:hypothetical protein